MPDRSASIRAATGARLHYVEFGKPDGHPVLFLHGWPDSWFSFSRVLELLPDDLRALAIDQRGFGESDRPESGYSIPELADDAIAFLDALELWGDKDALFSWTEQQGFINALPTARLSIYEETGHCPNWEQPERVAADIAALVARG